MPTAFNMKPIEHTDLRRLGAVAAALSMNSGDAEEIVKALLDALKHRGTVIKTASAKEGKGSCAIGYASNHDVESQLHIEDPSALALDGSIFGTSQPASLFLTKLAQASAIAGGARALLREPGAFASVFSKNKKLYAFRDINGLRPLYYARRGKLAAFTSERKALWRIGLKDAQRVIPGRLYSINGQKFTNTLLARLPNPKEKTMTIRQASLRLSLLLKKSVQRIASGVTRLAISFSGGLDSALTAVLAKKVNPDLEAVSVGLPGSPELPVFEQFARRLDLPITVQTFSVDSLEGFVRRVVWLIEEPNLMKVSVAVPLHWSAMVAAKRGSTVMLCGQGSDELYGGYYKYAKTLDREGRKALGRELYRSVVDSAQVNYERDDQATSPFGVELRTPFADLDVIRFSLSIPSEFKVREGNDLTRKWVLRMVAKEAGIPDDIVWRRKKAIQHGTGVENAIRKLAKDHGLSAEGYLSKVYGEVMGMESMP